MVSYVALMVRSDTPEAALSPLFAKAGWILFVEPATDSRALVRNRGRSSDWVCQEVLCRGARRLACGFIDPTALGRLTAAGVDVRLGPCSVPALELIERFATLPRPFAPYRTPQPS